MGEKKNEREKKPEVEGVGFTCIISAGETSMSDARCACAAELWVVGRLQRSRLRGSPASGASPRPARSRPSQPRAGCRRQRVPGGLRGGRAPAANLSEPLPGRPEARGRRRGRGLGFGDPPALQSPAPCPRLAPPGPRPRSPPVCRPRGGGFMAKGTL